MIYDAHVLARFRKRPRRKTSTLTVRACPTCQWLFSHASDCSRRRSATVPVDGISAARQWETAQEPPGAGHD
jgi:hypothetical protein